MVNDVILMVVYVVGWMYDLGYETYKKVLVAVIYWFGF